MSNLETVGRQRRVEAVWGLRRQTPQSRVDSVWSYFRGHPWDGGPLGDQTGLPRARRPRPRPGWTPDCCRLCTGRPLHSFLLNTFHRISLICASLWFESQREWEKETTVFVTRPKLRAKVKVGVSCVSGCVQRLVWVTSLMAQSGVLRESSLAVGDLTSAVGDVDGLSVAVLVVSRPGEGGSPRLHLPLQVHDAWASLADVTGKIASP